MDELICDEPYGVGPKTKLVPSKLPCAWRTEQQMEAEAEDVCLAIGNMIKSVFQGRSLHKPDHYTRLVRHVL